MLLGVLTVCLALLWALAGGRGLRPTVPAVEWVPVLLVGLAGLLVVSRGAPEPPLGTAVAIVAHACLLATGIVNFRLPGAAALTAGVASNGAVILANGGMPVAANAVVAVGGDPTLLPATGNHHLLTETTRLPWLADVVGLPVVDRVVSSGDALLVVGAVALLTAALTGEVDEH